MQNFDNVKAEIDDLCMRFGVPVPKVELSGRMKVTAGFWYTPSAKYPNSVIRIAKNYFERYDWNVIRGTVIHEFVHHYLYWHYRQLKYSDKDAWDKCKHTYEFKKMCADLGGTMNEQLAGKEFAHAASTSYVLDDYKWKYVCDCGTLLKKARRALSQRELKNKICGKCGEKMAHANKLPYKKEG